MKKTIFRTVLFVYIYLRVSTEEQARDAYGLQSQEQACREFCQKRGWIVKEVFCDRGVSAWSDVKRPEFVRMMKAIQKDRDANIVFYDYSRFGRKTLPALKEFDKLDSLGVLSIAATNPGIDCTTAAGRTARRDELSKAEDFSDCHSEKKQQLRMKAAFEDGRWIRRAPLGYENVNIKVKGQPNIVPHEAEAPLVRKAFELVQAGNDRPAEILRVMTELGLRSKKGNKLILTSFLQMLRNPVYMGQMQSKKWGTCKGLHSPLVTEHIFRNVQLILKGKKPIVAPYQLNRPDFPLRGFLRCHECNRPLTGGASKSQTGKLYDYYHCYRCPKRKSMPANKAANEFLQLLAQLRVDDSFSTEFSAQIKEEWETRTVDSAQIIRKLNIELQEKRGFQEKLFAKYLNDDPNVLPHYERFSQRS